MSVTSEVRAILCRDAQCVIGPGSPRDVWNLIDWFGPAIEQTHSPIATTGEYRFLPDGRGRLKLPILLNEVKLAHVALHELAHYATEERPVGLTTELSPAALALSERDAEDFADAFLLPKEVIDQVKSMADAYDLADDFGIPLERIERRKETLKRLERVIVSEPPPWSAWHHYRVELHRHPVLNRFRLVPMSAHCVPLEIPVAPRMYVPTLRAIHWDLLALRLHEFQHKHHAGAKVEIECAGMMFQELVPLRTRTRKRG